MNSVGGASPGEERGSGRAAGGAFVTARLSVAGERQARAPLARASLRSATRARAGRAGRTRGYFGLRREGLRGRWGDAGREEEEEGREPAEVPVADVERRHRRSRGHEPFQDAVPAFPPGERPAVGLEDEKFSPDGGLQRGHPESRRREGRGGPGAARGPRTRGRGARGQTIPRSRGSRGDWPPIASAPARPGRKPTRSR